MAFAADTQVALPGGASRPIGATRVGDQVLAAAGSGAHWAWTPQTVVASMGTAAADSLMVGITLADGRQLVVTPNQLFMLVGGLLIPADQLRPGTDTLLGADGQPQGLTAVSMGEYGGAIQAIAVASQSWNGSLDNHLINASGLIGGDYVLEVNQASPQMTPYRAPPGPVIGTPEYEAQTQHANLTSAGAPVRRRGQRRPRADADR